MIGRLVGLIAEEEADGALVLVVSGVGYEVAAPLGTTGRLRALSPTGPHTLFIHTNVREDALELFGFATRHDRDVFRAVIAVSGVGPRTALSVLSALPGGELARVIARKEIARLVAISGIGKKTAERLLLELRDKLPAPTGAAAPPAEGPRSAAASATAPDTRELLVSALTRMGYKPAEAERAAGELDDKLGDLSLSDAVREALRVLAKGLHTAIC